jgi:hypothetical protein
VASTAFSSKIFSIFFSFFILRLLVVSAAFLLCHHPRKSIWRYYTVCVKSFLIHGFHGFLSIREGILRIRDTSKRNADSTRLPLPFLFIHYICNPCREFQRGVQQSSTERCSVLKLQYTAASAHSL